MDLPQLCTVAKNWSNGPDAVSSMIYVSKQPFFFIIFTEEQTGNEAEFNKLFLYCTYRIVVIISRLPV